MRIDSVASHPDRAGRYTVRFSDGSALRLYRQTVADFGLYSGMELEEARMEQLRLAAGQMSAKMRAVRIVSASTVSAGELERRLVHKGEDPAQARQAVEWMQELDLVDDRQTALLLVRRCADKGYGLARAKQLLYEKRVPKAYWEEALADYPDQTEAITAFLRSRLGDTWTPQELRKATDALLRRGHSYSQIRQALRALSENADDFLEE